MMVTHQKLLLYFRLEIYFFCSDILAAEGIVCVCSIISKLQSCREPKKNHTRRKSKPTTSSITESPYPLISHYPECRVYFIIIECSHSLAQTILKDLSYLDAVSFPLHRLFELFQASVCCMIAAPPAPS